MRNLAKIATAATALIALAAGAVGCASARMSDRETDKLFRSERYGEAAERLRRGLAEQGENGRDQLLYLLDLGLTLHTAGEYEESNRALLRADKIAEIKDYTSLATESATLLTSDNIRDYKGEDFEKVLINTYLAMNFALMGHWEDALVEARRVNHKLHLMVTDGQRKYKQNAFARYLSAVLYEISGEANDAYLDYKKAWELEPGFPGIARDLWRTARLSGLRDEADRVRDEFELTREDRDEAMLAGPRSGKGEIIVLYENGISPVKRPNPDFTQVPRFYPRLNPVRQARVEIAPSPGAAVVASGPTAVLHDIETTAIANLDEKYGGIVARKIAGVVAKEVVADQVEKKTGSPLLGALAKIFMYASDQADVRSWNLLPRDLQLARFPVDPGTYDIQVLPEGASPLARKTVQVAAGRKIFVLFRYVP